jgi:hypothetical protein
MGTIERMYVASGAFRSMVALIEAGMIASRERAMRRRHEPCW